VEKIKRDSVFITNNVTITDTVTMQILTANAWKLQEMRGVLGGNNRYYLRGGTTNTENFDNEYILFKHDNTAIYIDNNSRQYGVTWNFTDATRTKLVLTMHNTPATYNVTWDNIRYRNNRLYFDNYYRDGNLFLNEHSQNIRIPR
jgi:hypothetical protein